MSPEDVMLHKMRELWSLGPALHVKHMACTQQGAALRRLFGRLCLAALNISAHIVITAARSFKIPVNSLITFQRI